MNDAVHDARPLAERLTPEDLPRLAIFLGAYLQDDVSLAPRSAQEAAWEYVAEAELDELQELAHDWEVLRAAARELPLAEVNRLLRERFGSSWSALSREEIEAVGAEFERAVRE